MTTAATLLTLIAHAQQGVAALESLAASMTAGLRAGMVDADLRSLESHAATARNRPSPRVDGASHADQACAYSSLRRHQILSSLRPNGARSSHGYIPHSASRPRAYVE